MGWDPFLTGLYSRPVRTSFRSAGPADVPRVAALAGILGYSVEVEGLGARLDELLDREDHGVWVAEKAGRVLGFVHATVHRSLLGSSEVLLAALVVDPEARGEGIGRALVDRAAEWGRERGLDAMRVRTRLSREGARVFYRRLGFEQTKEQALLRRRPD